MGLTANLPTHEYLRLPVGVLIIVNARDQGTRPDVDRGSTGYLRDNLDEIGQAIDEVSLGLIETLGDIELSRMVY
jgi:hypothetical protein